MNVHSVLIGFVPSGTNTIAATASCLTNRIGRQTARLFMIGHSVSLSAIAVWKRHTQCRTCCRLELRNNFADVIKINKNKTKHFERHRTRQPHTVNFFLGKNDVVARRGLLCLAVVA